MLTRVRIIIGLQPLIIPVFAVLPLNVVRRLASTAARMRTRPTRTALQLFAGGSSECPSRRTSNMLGVQWPDEIGRRTSSASVNIQKAHNKRRLLDAGNSQLPTLKCSRVKSALNLTKPASESGSMDTPPERASLLQQSSLEGSASMHAGDTHVRIGKFDGDDKRPCVTFPANSVTVVSSALPQRLLYTHRTSSITHSSTSVDSATDSFRCVWQTTITK